MQISKTDLFTFIHKSLRSIIYDSSSGLQVTNFRNFEETESMLNILIKNLELLHEHAENEDNIIFPEIAEIEPIMIKELNEEHKDLELKLKDILSQVERIRNSTFEEERFEQGIKLNDLFNDFAATYLAHMNHEEQTVLKASQKYLSDAELIAIRTRIQTKISSEQYKIWLNWMLKSLNNYELKNLLIGMRAGAPKQVLDYVLDVMKNIISESRLKLILKETGFN